MSTQVSDTVQASGFQSLTKAAIGHVKVDKGAKRVFDAATIPLCALADMFRAPAYYVGQLVKSSPEVTVTEESQSQKTSADVRKMESRCFKTLSQLQTLGSTNAHRVRYNNSVLGAVRDLSAFADEHSSSDTLEVLKSLKRHVSERYGHETVIIGSNTYCSTKSAQLLGVNANISDDEYYVIHGFMPAVKDSGVGQIAMRKAVEELTQAISEDPLSDESIPAFQRVLEGLKKLGLLSQEEVNTALSGDAGQAVAEAFSKASERVMTDAQETDLSSVRKILASRSSSLSAAFGLSGVNMRAVFNAAKASRDAVKVAKQADIAEEEQMEASHREGLEKQADDLQQRLALEQKVKDLALKVKGLEFQIKNLKKTPTDKMAALMAKIKANPTEAELVNLMKELDAIKAEAKKKIAQLHQGQKKNKNIQQQVAKLQKELDQALAELTQAKAELAKFKKEHSFVFFPQYALKKVQAQLAQFDEGVPVQQRRGWIIPILETAVVITGLAAVATLVINRNPYGYGEKLASCLQTGWSAVKTPVANGLGAIRSYVEKKGFVGVSH
jgi:hypothetical protein